MQWLASFWKASTKLPDARKTISTRSTKRLCFTRSTLCARLSKKRACSTSEAESLCLRLAYPTRPNTTSTGHFCQDPVSAAQTKKSIGRIICRSGQFAALRNNSSSAKKHTTILYVSFIVHFHCFMAQSFARVLQQFDLRGRNMCHNLLHSHATEIVSTHKNRQLKTRQLATAEKHNKSVQFSS